MKIRGFKNLITFIRALFISLLFLILCLTFVNIDNYAKKSKNHKVEAADMITSISTYDDLTNFAKSVGEGNNYSGRIVNLEADINCSKKTFYSIGTKMSNFRDDITVAPDGHVPFAGTFNGNGYSIQNFVIYDAFPGGDTYGCGLFVSLARGAKVKNLGLKSGAITSTRTEDVARFLSSSYSGSSIGGIAGFIADSGSGKVEIDNCLIDDLKINCSDEYGERIMSVGGILGANHNWTSGATITNCFVNKIAIKGYNNDFSDYETYIGGIVGYDMELQGSYIASVSKCIVNSSGWSFSSSGSQGATQHYFTNTATQNCYTSANQTSGLNCSSTGGAYVSGKTTEWFYVSTYKNGYPQLRAFMRWDTYSFAAVNGTVSTSSISVPNDVRIDPDLTKETLTFFSQTVTGTPKNNSFTFKEWQVSNGTYTIYYEPSELTITFRVCDNTNRTTSDSKPTDEEITYVIKANTIITVTKTEFSKNNCYSQIVYSFSNSSGTSISVTYTANSKYYLTCIDSTHEVTYNEPFYVTAELKIYNTYFT